MSAQLQASAPEAALRRERRRLLLKDLRLLPRVLTAGARVLPDFLIIGAQKSGTTTLSDHLRAHPAVAAAYQKEIHFFDRYHHRGERWLRAFFPTAAQMRALRGREGQAICGDATPYYLFHPQIPERARQVLPGARLIAILREPGERAFSHYLHEFRRGRETLPFVDAIARERQIMESLDRRLEEDAGARSFEHQHFSYLQRGLYWRQLQRWCRHYPRQQLLVLTTAGLAADPAGTMEKVCRFLGLDAARLPQATVHSNRAPRAETMPAAQRDELTEFFAEENAKLAADFGITFPVPGSAP